MKTSDNVKIWLSEEVPTAPSADNPKVEINTDKAIVSIGSSPFTGFLEVALEEAQKEGAITKQFKVVFKAMNDVSTQASWLIDYKKAREDGEDWYHATLTATGESVKDKALDKTVTKILTTAAAAFEVAVGKKLGIAIAVGTSIYTAFAGDKTKATIGELALQGQELALQSFESIEQDLYRTLGLQLHTYDGSIYNAEREAFINNLSPSQGFTIEELLGINGNSYLPGRYFKASDIDGVPNVEGMYLLRTGDKLYYPSPEGYDPQDSLEFVYPQYHSTEVNPVQPSLVGHIELMSNEFTVDEAIAGFRFAVDSIVCDDTTYVGVKGDAIRDALAKHMGDATELDLSGFDQIINEVNGMVYANQNAQIGVPDGNGGQYFVAAGQLVNMVEQGAVGLIKFTQHLIDSNIVQGSLCNIQEQTPMFIAEVISRLLQGQDIEDIIKPLAMQLVQAGINPLIKELKTQANEFMEQKGLTSSEDFNILDQLEQDHPMAYEAVTGALTAVAILAITKGKEVGLADYERAAANASVKNVLNYGITSNGYNVLTQKAFAAPAIDVAGPNFKLVPSPAGAGAIAAVTVLASSLIAGNGINEDTIRGAAVAGANAYAATAATGAILTYMGYGAAVGGPVGAAVGLVLGAVLGLVQGNLFGTPGERVYHNESIGSYVSGDTIIGVRETGALLMAKGDIVNAVGTEGEDRLVGDDRKNSLVANGGDDYLEGRGDEDALIAGSGNDHSEGGDGDDYIDNGDGNDIAFGNRGNDIILGANGDDILSGGEGDDKLEGGAGNDVIFGDSGNDIITGGIGDDFINGGAGNDVVDGGDGNDVIDGNVGSDKLHGGDGNDIIYAGDGNDIINGDSGDDIIYGDGGIDKIYGDIGDDIIDGGEGDDLIYGGLGKDVLFGDKGVDHIYGELGDDYLVGGEGDDLLDGGEGDDVYSFNKGDGKDTVQDSSGTQDIIRLSNYTLAEVTFIKSGNDLILRTVNPTDEVTIKDQLTDKSIEYLVFSDNTTINLASLVFNADGSVTYEPEPDATALITEATFAGTWQEADASRTFMEYNISSQWYTNNYDTAVMTTDTERQLYNDVQVKATIIKHKHWYGRTTTTVHYNDYFEQNLTGVTISDHGTEVADRIVGAHWNENINGLGGNDQLYGNGGDDTITGGTGHDIIFGGSGNDTINGGSDNDKIYGGIGNDILNGDDGNDTLYGAWGNDTMRGGTGDDFLSGGSGDDSIFGDAGNDTIQGDAGNDNLQGNDGNDHMSGGDGNDTMYGGTGNDYMSGGKGADYLDGGDGNDTIRGDDDTDTLIGGAGDDILVGGKGVDNINGGTGIDTASYAESNDGVTINLITGAALGGYAEGDTLANVENVEGSDFDDVITGDNNNNILIGGYGNDKLYGGIGNDTLDGGAGADILDGGNGFDMVSYAKSNSGVEINLVTRTGKRGYAEGDTLINIEHVIGSAFNDKFIIGDISSPSGITFEGGAGNDSVVLTGNVADYNIILDGSTYKITRKSDSAIYVLPNIEQVQFNDKLLTYEDFPAGQNSLTSVPYNTATEGVIDHDILKIMVMSHTVQYGSTSFNSDGIFTYTPDNVGSDEFRYTLTNINPYNLTRLVHVGFSVVDTASIQSTQVPNTIPSIGGGNPISGTMNADTITGTIGNDTIKGKAGNDNIDGGSGNDQIEAGSGDDIVNGGDGDDIINGGYTSVDFIAGAEIQVNAYTYSDQNYPDITYLQNGGYVMAWYSGGQGGVWGQIFYSNGNKSGVEFKISTSLTGDIPEPSIASLTNGGFVVTWDKRGGYNGNSYSVDGVYAQIYGASGEKVGGEFLVNTTPYTNATDRTFNQMSQSVTGLNNGTFIVTWHKNSTGHSYAKIFNNSGGIIVDEFKTNTADIGNTARAWASTITTLKDGSFIALWAGEYNTSSISGIYGQHYSAAGAKMGNTFLVSTYTNTYSQYIHFSRSSTGLENGGFVVTWLNGSSIYGQVLDSNGNKSGNTPFIVSTVTLQEVATSNTATTSVTSLKDGSFVVIWSKTDAIYCGVYGQHYSANGTKIGEQFLVNTFTNGEQDLPTVTGLLNGDFVVSWRSYGQDGSTYGVYQKLYTATNSGADGNDTLHGGDGNDTIYGGDGNNTLFGDAGNDTLYGGSGNDTIYGDLGDGAIVGGNDILVGGDGNNILYGEGGDDYISSGSGSDILNGGDGNDTLISGDGNDTLIGGTGNDIIYAGTGIDTINGGDGDDTIYADTGDDNISGDNGNDLIFAGDGNDTVTGDDGDDTIYGGIGIDTINGDNGNDIINGDNGNDILTGGDGDDTIFGGDGNDAINGGNGDDIIAGDGGDDIIFGEAGNDKIYVGLGNDVISGGDGYDTAIFTGNFTDYKITAKSDGATPYIIVTNSNGSAQTNATIYSNVEKIVFADRSLELGIPKINSLKNNVVTGLTDLQSGGTALFAAQHGSVVFNTNGTYTYTPIANYTGSDSVSYIISESGGMDKIISVAINVRANDNLVSSLNGTSFNDILQGTSGNNTFIGYTGKDVIDGDIGTDTLSYAASGAGVILNLAALNNFGSGQYATGYGGDAEGDRVANIENIIGSGYNDIFGGNGANNLIDGRDGDDTVIYTGVSSGYSIVLSDGTITITDTNTSNGNDGIDTLINIEQLNFANKNFTLVDFPQVENGSASVKKNIATKGNLGGINSVGETFTIKTAASHGNATLYNVNSTYTYTPTTNYVGADLFSYIVKNANGLSKAVSVSVNVQTSFNSTVATDGNDVIQTGSSNNDVIYVTDGYGIDTYTTGAGNDTIVVGLAPNTKDIITDFSVLNDKIDLNGYNFMLRNYGDLKAILSQQGSDAVINFGYSQSLVLQSVTINALTITNFIGNATIYTAPSVGMVIGAQSGLAGNTFNYIVPTDAFVDADGDTLVYNATSGGGSALPSWLTFDPITRSFTGTPLSGSALALSLKVKASDWQLSASQTFALNIATNVINGTPGNDDNLTGTPYNDEIYGLNGHDTIVGDLGADKIDGGAGWDNVSYHDSTVGININLESNVNTGGSAEGDTLFNIEAVWGTPYNDTMYGSASDDYFAGGAGDNILIGNDGNDTLESGSGNDYLDGGTGSDYANYYKSDARIVVDLFAGIVSGGYAEGDTLISIENVVGSPFNDDIIGNAQDNVLFGSADNDYLFGGVGNDTLNGEAGNDRLEGGAGADIIDGGDGIDLVQYQLYGGVGVVVDLSTGQGYFGDAEGDIFIDIENVDGTSLNDIIIGDNNDNRFWGGYGGDDEMHGGGGNDTLLGDAGNDILYGDDGDDELDGGDGNDILSGGLGADRIDGGAGSDTASYADSTVLVKVSLVTGAINTGGSAAGDVLTNIENLIGSKYADNLTGDANNNVFTGGLGADKIDGGAGIDTASYADSTALVKVSLVSGAANTGGSAAGDVLTNIENIIGSNFNDTLTGNANANNLFGESGDDLIIGGLGADMLDGGAGINTVSYSDSTVAVTVSLVPGAINTGGSAEGDILSSFTNLIGSKYADILTGDANNNTITGGLGADTINGGSGMDTVSYIDSTVAVTVSLISGSTNTGGSAAGDILTNIENLTGSNYNDILIGDANNNTITGGLGNDTVTGGLGADNIDGGAGIDTASYTDSTVAVTVNLLTNVNSGGSAAGDTLSNIENLIGSKYADNLTGNASNNTFTGGLGADIINGGAGIDTASYADSTALVNVSLVAGAVNTGGSAAGDVLTNIENLIGSSKADTLTGDANNNVLTGGLGADIINGGAGIDTASYADSTALVNVSLVAGAVNTGGSAAGDVLTNIENLIGSSKADTLTGDANNNVFTGGLGADNINGGAGIDTASYTDSTVAVVASLIAGAVNTGGSAAGDILTNIENLTGSNFNDNLTGDINNNTITGGLGADTLTGGLGIDVFRFNTLLDSKNGTSGAAFDTITDFTVGQDKIDIAMLGSFGIHSFSNVVVTTLAPDVSNPTGQTIITANDIANPTNTDRFELHLTGVQSVTPADFIFG